MRRAYRALIAETGAAHERRAEGEDHRGGALAKDGFITRNEMVAKIKDIAEIDEYEEIIG